MPARRRGPARVIIESVRNQPLRLKGDGIDVEQHAVYPFTDEPTAPSMM